MPAAKKTTQQAPAKKAKTSKAAKSETFVDDEAVEEPQAEEEETVELPRKKDDVKKTYVSRLSAFEIEKLRARFPTEFEEGKFLKFVSKVGLELPKLPTSKLMDTKTAEWAVKKREAGEEIAETLKLSIFLDHKSYPEAPRLSEATLDKLTQIDGLIETFFEENFSEYAFYSPLKNVEDFGVTLQVNMKPGKFDKPIYRDGKGKVTTKIPTDQGFVRGVFFINIYAMSVTKGEDIENICGWTLKPQEVQFYPKEQRTEGITLSDAGASSY
jgi:hypothetical protein